MSIRATIGSALLAASLTTCGGDAGTGPPAPVATTVDVSPAAVTIGPGQTTQLQAEVRDQQGAVMAGAAVTWTSSGTDVATVDASGLVTGVTVGEATISARSGSASGGAAVTVEIQSMTVTSDVDLSGTVLVDDFTVAPGATVTATADLSVQAAGSILVQGSVAGGCVAIELTTEAELLRVEGDLSNDCAEGGEDQPGVSLVSGGGWEMDGADVVSSGSIVIATAGTEEHAGSPAPSPRRSALRSGHDCDIKDSSYRTDDGADGSDAGPSGRAAGEFVGRCSGQLTISNTSVTTGDGGDGANVSEDGDGVEVLAGRGGDGGRIWIGTTEGMSLQGTVLDSGDGGDGGNASATGRDVTADAGRGGSGGEINVVGSTDEDDDEVVVNGAAGLTIRWGDGGEGGVATAVGEDGDDATGTTPAQTGGSATAFGGSGGSSARTPERLVQEAGFGNAVIIGDNITGVIGVVFDIGPSGSGGAATAVGGNGGNGSRDFPIGAKAGDMTAEGGGGGDVNIRDARFVVSYPGSPGDGGAAVFRNGNGGLGYADCRVTEGIQEGGDGGSGGDAEGHAGEGGEDPDSDDGEDGDTTYDNVGNGAAGGAGDPPGNGGAKGVNVTQPPKPPIEMGENFQDGPRGSFCSGSFSNGVEVEEDTGNLEGSIGMVGTTGMFVGLFAGDLITWSGLNPFPLIERGPFDPETLEFDIETTDRFLGIDDVSVRFTGTLTADSEGRLIGYEGTLTIGEDGKLPGGYRVVYGVTGTRE